MYRSKARIVSPLLIIAIIACPLFCDSGLCVSCCAASDAIVGQHVASLDRVESPHQLPSCCCEPKAKPQNPPPCPAPIEKKFCQGVCGGAVFEKPVELDLTAQLVAVLSDESSVFACHCDRGTFGVAKHWLCDGGNQGRALRTWHGSLLL